MTTTKAKPTLADLARGLGVARSTVSRALRDDPRIGAATRDRVHRLANSLGYRPNAAARALTRGRTSVIGLLFPRSSAQVFANPYFSELLLGVSSRAEGAGYALLLSTEPRPDFGAWLREERVDGMILLGSSVRQADLPILTPLVARGQAVVSVHAPPRALHVPSIGSNERAGVWQALAHLQQLGHRRVAFLAGPRGSRYAEHRVRAYRTGVTTFGLEADRGLVSATDDTRQGGSAAIAKLLQAGVDFTAVMADNDLVALGAVAALEDVGLRVPDDVSVIGFDDTAVAGLVRPGLTSVRQPVRQLGELAFDALERRMAGEKVDSVRLATRLIVRGTTAAASDALRARTGGQRLAAGQGPSS